MDWTPTPPSPLPALAAPTAHDVAAALGVCEDEDEDEGELARAGARRPRKKVTRRTAVTVRLTTLQLQQAEQLLKTYQGRAVQPEAVVQLAGTLRVDAAVLQEWFLRKEGLRTRAQAALNANLSAAPVPTPREVVTDCADCGTLRVVSEQLLKSRRVRVRCCGIIGADGVPLACGTPSEFVDATAAAAWTATKGAERAAAVLPLPGRHPRGSRAVAAAVERPLPKQLHQTLGFRKLRADLKKFYFEEDNGGAALPAGGDGGDEDEDEAAGEEEVEEEGEEEEEEEDDDEEEADENVPPVRRGGVQPKLKPKPKRASRYRWTPAKNRAVTAAAEAMGLFAARTTGAAVCAAMTRDGTLPAGLTALRVSKLLLNHRETVGCVRRRGRCEPPRCASRGVCACTSLICTHPSHSHAPCCTLSHRAARWCGRTRALTPRAIRASHQTSGAAASHPT